MDPSEAESEPVSPLLDNKPLGDEEGPPPEESVHAAVVFSLQLEETRKDR